MLFALRFALRALLGFFMCLPNRHVLSHKSIGLRPSVRRFIIYRIVYTMSCSIDFDDVLNADLCSNVCSYLDVSYDADSPDSPDGLAGNTKTKPSNPKKKKQDNGRVEWVFTWNNYPENYKEFFSPDIPDVDQYTFGREVGDEKETPHLQGYIRFKKYKKKRLTWLKNQIHPQIRWAYRSKNSTSRQAIEYCWKEDPNPVCYRTGRPPKLLKFDNMYPWQQDIRRMVRHRDEDATFWSEITKWHHWPSGVKTLDREWWVRYYKPDRSIIWLYCKDGGCGKSQLGKYLCVKERAIIVDGKTADMKYLVNERIKQGAEPDLIIMDISRSKKKHKIDYGGIEEIKNGLFVSTKYECGMVVMNPPMIIIFANFEPDYEKLSYDRWICHEIVDKKLVSRFINGERIPDHVSEMHTNEGDFPSLNVLEDVLNF